jgi:phage shock protein PspC (stress-responsive transcriptional regulator)
MLIALSDAAKANIAIIAIWVVLFPALVTGLIAFAIAQAVAERSENLERRNRRAR